jgi:hypothetical protein
MLIKSPGNSKPMIPSAIFVCFMRDPSRPSSPAAVVGGVGGGVGERDGGRLLRERLDESYKDPRNRAGIANGRLLLCCCSLLLFSAVALCCCSLR